jgi:hypothetical protein
VISLGVVGRSWEKKEMTPPLLPSLCAITHPSSSHDHLIPRPPPGFMGVLFVRFLLCGGGDPERKEKLGIVGNCWELLGEKLCFELWLPSFLKYRY